MVQEYQSPVRVYKHPFELIMAVSSLQNIPQHFHSILELSRPSKVTSAGFFLLLIKLKEKHMIIFGIKGLKTLPSKGGCSKCTVFCWIFLNTQLYSFSGVLDKVAYSFH